MSVIPDGCTKYLQSLDVCIDKPFKQYFRELYDEWFHKGEFKYTSGGKIKAPSHLQQVKWIVQAWNEVSKDIIINSFDVCGITTDNASKISRLRNEHCEDNPVHPNTATNLDDIVDDCDSSDDDCVLAEYAGKTS